VAIAALVVWVLTAAMGVTLLITRQAARPAPAPAPGARAGLAGPGHHGGPGHRPG
jgi:hypothetical protein